MQLRGDKIIDYRYELSFSIPDKPSMAIRNQIPSQDARVHPHCYKFPLPEGKPGTNEIAP